MLQRIWGGDENRIERFVVQHVCRGIGRDAEDISYKRTGTRRRIADPDYFKLVSEA
jgi:hypothetical protein